MIDKNELEQAAHDFASKYKFSPIEGDVIKGHVLLELALDDYIKSKVKNPAVYNPTKLNFDRKVYIARLVGDISMFEASITTLTTLRNKIGHHETYDGKLMDQFLQADSLPKFKEDEFQNSPVKRKVSFMCGVLYSMAKEK